MVSCIFLSPLQEDVGPISLSTDSLRQFSETFEYDFDAVVSAITSVGLPG